jgi:tRNA threonylcarbamoyladenosine biosynthesis protein TsaB
MIVLTIRTDKSEAELGLFYGTEQRDYLTWPAERELSLTILDKITELLKRNDLSFQQLEGVVGFAGPGSFTGLRIGLTVANTLAYGLRVPIVGSTAEDWIQDGIARLQNGENVKIALPKYDREPNISRPKS